MNIYKIMCKEILYNVFNYWFFLAAFIFCIVNFIIIYFGEIISGDYSQTDIRSLSLSLIHLQMYLIPLFSFILSYDSILSERESGVLDLLLSYRITFFDILIGKLLGNSIIFACSFILGFFPICVYLILLGIKFFILLKFICISVWLGFIFNAFALYVSTSSKDRTFVILFSIFVWLLFIFIYDMLFTFFVMFFHGDVSNEFLSFILLFNPAEIFRLLSILYLLPQDANDLFGIGVSTLKLVYIECSMIFWCVVSFLGFFLIYIRSK